MILVQVISLLVCAVTNRRACFIVRWWTLAAALCRPAFVCRCSCQPATYALCLQVIEMMRLLFPPHIVDLATTGHRVAVESLSCVVVLSLHIHGFRTMSSSVPMATAVSKVSSLLNMMSTEALSRGLEQADMAHDKFVACAIAECAPSACPDSCTPHADSDGVLLLLCNMITQTDQDWTLGPRLPPP